MVDSELPLLAQTRLCKGMRRTNSREDLVPGKKAILFYMGCLLTLSAFYSAFHYTEGHEAWFSMVLCFVVGPLLGLYQLLNFYLNRDMSILTLNADPDEYDMRIFLAIFAFFMIAWPIVYVFFRSI